MKVYHGSYAKINGIDLSKCEIGRDFGQGFYVTKIREQAQFWAERKGLDNGAQGCVTEFEYRETAFTRSVCKIKHFENYDGEWLDFVVLNRKNEEEQQAHDYDIVEGPVADDRITTRIKKYLKGGISKQQFLEELKFVKETHQICFCTGRSLQMLKYVDNPQDIEYELSEIGEPVVERLMLDRDMDEVAAADAFYSSQTFARLADESTGLYRRPWREIYEMLKQELKI